MSIDETPPDKRQEALARFEASDFFKDLAQDYPFEDLKRNGLEDVSIRNGRVLLRSINAINGKEGIKDFIGWLVHPRNGIMQPKLRAGDEPPPGLGNGALDNAVEKSTRSVIDAFNQQQEDNRVLKPLPSRSRDKPFRKLDGFFGRGVGNRRHSVETPSANDLIVGAARLLEYYLYPDEHKELRHTYPGKSSQPPGR